MTISTQRLRFLRGNTAASSAFTGLGGELIVDTTLNTIRVQDGYTPGGTVLVTQAMLANASVSGNYGNANVAAFLPTYTGNLGVNNLIDNNGQALNLVSNNYVQMQYDPTGTYDPGNLQNGSWGYIASGGFFFQSNVTGTWKNIILNDNGTISADGGLAFDGNLTNGSSTWNFAANGVLTFPGSTMSMGHSMGDYIYTSDNFFVNSLTTTLSAAPDGGNLSQINMDGYGNVSIRTIINNGNDSSWNFRLGALTLPGGANFVTYNDTGAVDLAANVAVDSYIGLTYDNRNWMWVNNNAAYIETSDGSTGRTWTFGLDGGTIFPSLTTVRGDTRTGSLTGQTLLFGDDTNQAVISTPNAQSGSNGSSQRLVINPGQGDGVGEGGDIYLWAGRGGATDGNGGDIKIRGGYGPGNGSGGYIRIEAGDVQSSGTAGYIDLVGGSNGDLVGGYVNIDGGPGGTDGGAITIDGGPGNTGDGGAVTITGGSSAQGLSRYGNVRLQSGASTWSFNNDGTTQFPSNAIHTPIDNQLDINTSTSDYDDNHLNISAKSLDLYVYNNDANSWAEVLLDNTNNSAPTANIHVSATGGTEKIWGFASDGNLTLPASGNINYSNGVNILSGITGNVNTGDITFSGNDIIGLSNNVTITADTTDWVFNSNGSISMPGNVNQLMSGYPGAGYVNNVASLVSEAAYLANPSGNTYVGTSGTLVEIGTPGGYWTFNADGSTSFPDHKQVTITGNLTVGNLYVNGNTTTINTNSYVVSDNIITMADGNPADILDLGFVAHRTVGSVLQHTGLVRDASANSWKLFSNVIPNPGNTVDFTDAIYDAIQTGNITAPYFIGNGALLTGMASSFGNANVAAYLPTYTGNLSAANISLTNNTSAITFNTGAYIYGDTVSRPGSIFLQPNTSVAGFPSVIIGGAGRLAAPNGSVHVIFNTNDLTVQVPLKVTTGTVSTSTTTGALQITGGAGLTGNIFAAGNISGNYFIGNGALLTGIAASSNYGNTNVTAFLGAYGSNTIVTTGNITAGYFVGNGSLLTGIVTNTTYSNTNVAGYLTGNIVVGNVSGSQPNVTLVASTYSYVFSNVGNVSFPGNLSVTSNVSGNYFIGNGALLTGIVASGSNYGDSNVATFLSNIGSNSITTTGNVTAGYFVGNGALLTGIVASGSTYSNANVVSMLAANSAVFIGNVGNVSSVYSLQANNTQLFIGNNAGIASGNNATNSTQILYNTYISANGAPSIRNTQTGAGIISFDSAGFSVSGLTSTVTANTSPTLTRWITANAVNTTFSLPVVSTSSVTAAGFSLSSGSFVTSVASLNLFQSTATTINLGGAATAINMGSSAGNVVVAGNVWVGNAVGRVDGNLIIRANGVYNYVTSLNSNGGYGTTTYTNIATTGGSGTGMIISMTGVASGYLSSATVTNPGTGYRNGDTITIPAGNPTGSLGGSFVIQNYNSNIPNSTTVATGIYTFGMDGNLTLSNILTNNHLYANGVSITSDLYNKVYTNANVTSFLGSYGSNTIVTTGNITAGNLIGNASGTTATYTGNVTGSYFIGNGALLTGIAASANYSDSNVTSLLSSYGSNAISTTGNVTAGYFIGNGSTLSGLVYNNIGNIYGSSSNVTLQAGSYSWTFDNTGNLVIPTTSNIVYANGAIFTSGGGSSSNYTNSNVATFLASFGSNIISTTGNITAGNINANQFGNSTGTTATYTGNVTVGNLSISGNIVDTGALSIISGSNGNISLIPNGTGIVTAPGSLTAFGNVVTAYATQANASTLFIGNNTTISSGGASSGSTYVMNNAFYNPSGVLTGRNTSASGAGQFEIAGATFNWNATGSATANSAAGMGARMSLNSTALATQNSIGITSAGTLTVQGASGIVTTQTTFPLLTTVATTINFGNVANVITIGANVSTVTFGNGSGNISAGNITAAGNVTTGNISTTGVVTLSGGNVSGVGNLVGVSSNTTITANTFVTSFLSNGAITTTSNVIVTGSNAISIPNLPAFRVYGNTSAQYTGGTTLTNQVVDYNQGSYYNNTTGIFTAPVAGLYHCYATVRVGNNNGLNQASLQKNSSQSGANVIAFWESDTNVGTAVHFPMTGYAKCVAGDTIRLQAISGNINFDTNDSWGVTFIG